MPPPSRLIHAEDAVTEVAPARWDRRYSFGPFLALNGTGYLLDCTSRSGKPLLGFNASPLFGTAHHMGSWSTGQRSDEDRRLKTALLELANRCQANLANRLDPRRLEQLSQVINQTDASAAQVSRTYITLSVLDQYTDQLDQVAGRIRSELQRLETEFADLLAGYQVEGLQFELQFQEERQLERFHLGRFEVGLDFDLTGQAARFEWVLAGGRPALDLLWQQLERLLQATRGDSPAMIETPVDPPPSLEQNYHFTEQMLAARSLAGDHPIPETANQATVAYLQSSLEHRADGLDLQPVILDADSYTDYRDQVLSLQTDIYEPARQTSAEEFDAIFQSAHPVALLLLAEGRIAGMGLAGPIDQFPQVRGMATDPFRADPGTLYMVDVTVREEFRGGLGKLIKQAITLLAQQRGFRAIHGRNRDRLARGMWSINLSLGSFELQHLVDDYPDQGEFRDCLYYRCPLEWPAATRANDLSWPDRETMLTQLPGIINGP
ncbi:MAG: hypothetical protein MK108_02980 [Mariniblastus sp.]|nr:hypothetical protein [Mariniblastus sp.]